ncbi:hypothetical protein CIT31_25915 [Mesorhizobium wenxiniae]|uniref:Uncharacterized protein n=1 Tax=Mesorhizobium wenxiniae TaxID=2014805 RepID=A0A271KAE5_9HYPH|nr:hypothetical protein CIT31_25915 [Mesorhizobium wenxiniae]
MLLAGQLLHEKWLEGELCHSETRDKPRILLEGSEVALVADFAIPKLVVIRRFVLKVASTCAGLSAVTATCRSSISIGRDGILSQRCWKKGRGRAK